MGVSQMKITMDTINTVAYAIGKRMQGYTLLRNPKGSNPNEVNMMKSSFGIDIYTFDDEFSYTRLQRKKVDGKTIVTRKELYSTHFMDPETKQITNKKSLSYIESKNKEIILENCSDRDDIPIDEQLKRPKPKWKKSGSLFANDDEDLIYSNNRFAKERMKKFYQPYVTLLEKITTLGMAKSMRSDSRPFAQSFYKTLLANLKGGQ